MPGDPERNLSRDRPQSSVEDSPLRDIRRAELAVKYAALMDELVKLRELEREDSEPATPWPWKGNDHDG